MTKLPDPKKLNQLAENLSEKAFSKHINYHRKEGFIWGLMKCLSCHEISHTLEWPFQIEGNPYGQVTSSGPLNPCPHCGSVCNWHIVTKDLRTGQ